MSSRTGVCLYKYWLEVRKETEKNRRVIECAKGICHRLVAEECKSQDCYPLGTVALKGIKVKCPGESAEVAT